MPLDFSLGNSTEANLNGRRIGRIPPAQAAGEAGSPSKGPSSETIGVFGKLASGLQDYLYSKANASHLKLGAKFERAKGVAEAQAITEEGQAVKGAAINQQAANGVSVNSGSALQIQEKIASTSSNAATQALIEGKLKSMQLRTQAKLGEMQGRSSLITSLLSAGSTMANAKAESTAAAKK